MRSKPKKPTTTKQAEPLDLRAKLRPVIDTIVTELVEQAVAGVVDALTARLAVAMRFPPANDLGRATAIAVNTKIWDAVNDPRPTLVVEKEVAPTPPLGSWSDAMPSVVDRDSKPEKPPQQASPSVAGAKRKLSVEKGGQIRCKVCGELGHNARSHKGEQRSEQLERMAYEDAPPVPAATVTPAQQAILDRVKARSQAPQ